MPSKNVTRADNQQERSAMANWIVGFVDGEGSFLISIFRNATTSSGWQVFPEFVVTQGARSLKVLKKMQTYFGCGKVFINWRYDNHHEPIYRFCVRNGDDLREKVIPFFERYRLRTAKLEDFRKFRQTLDLMAQKIHLKEKGFERIRVIAETMNRKGIKKHS